MSGLITEPTPGAAAEEVVFYDDGRQFLTHLGKLTRVSEGCWIALADGVWTSHESRADALRRFERYVPAEAKRPTWRELAIAAALVVVAICWAVLR